MYVNNSFFYVVKKVYHHFYCEILLRVRFFTMVGILFSTHKLKVSFEVILVTINQINIYIIIAILLYTVSVHGHNYALNPSHETWYHFRWCPVLVVHLHGAIWSCVFKSNMCHWHWKAWFVQILEKNLFWKVLHLSESGIPLCSIERRRLTKRCFIRLQSSNSALVLTA